jgi:hypothetical protein
MLEETAKKARLEIDVPWDDVRQARVQKSALEAFRAAKQDDDADQERELQALEAKLDEPKGGRWRLMMAAAAVFVAAAVAMVWLRTNEPVQGAAWAVASLDYNDGSRSLLSERAQVQVVDDTKAKVEVRQRAGKVRYEITRRPERRFEIAAHDVVITVLGTVFNVDVAKRSVSVVVERGRVQVEHDGGKVVLTAGQSVTIATDGAVPNEVADDAQPDRAPPDSDEAKQEETTVAEVAVSAPSTGGGAPAGPSAAELLREADAARGRGDHTAAIAALNKLRRVHKSDPRVTIATFTLARIYREQGKHALAAQHFEACGKALRGDAIAEAAVSWSAVGDSARASAAAQRYLDAFPGGVHADHMRKLRGGS